MPPNFGFVPTNEKPQKTALDARLIPKGALHTGDGWIWQRLADGSVQLRQIGAASAMVQAQTLLSAEEWRKVRDLIEPAPSAAEEKAALARLQGSISHAIAEVEARLPVPIRQATLQQVEDALRPAEEAPAAALPPPPSVDG